MDGTGTDAGRQRAYYARTAAQYDGMHRAARGEHDVALAWLSTLVQMTGARSVLDVGSGTGRALLHLQQRHPGCEVTGIEPVAELREVALANGVPPGQIRDGDATRLDLADGSVDIVCAFGVLHHVREDERAVAEMARVARLGVFLSDCNNFGSGSPAWRLAKQAFNALGLWPLVDLLKTRGKGYTESEGDGIAYSYSVFNSTPILRRSFPELYHLNLRPSGPNLYRSASHVAVFATRPGTLVGE